MPGREINSQKQARFSLQRRLETLRAKPVKSKRKAR